jgi:hypothetical protein
MDLNRMLLDRAEKAGAAIEQTRVMKIERRDQGWSLRTRWHGRSGFLRRRHRRSQSTA